MKHGTHKKALRRLKILEGQVRGLQRMVELSGIDDLILENHLSTHVIEQIKDGKDAQPTKEIMAIYKLAKKK